MELTQEEIKWLKRVQKALDSCPSSRLGFYTIGGYNVGIYDKDEYDNMDSRITNNNDLVHILNKYDIGCEFHLGLPAHVEGVCG